MSLDMRGDVKHVNSHVNCGSRGHLVLVYCCKVRFDYLLFLFMSVIVSLNMTEQLKTPSPSCLPPAYSCLQANRYLYGGWPPPNNQGYSTPAPAAATGIYPILSCPKEVDFVILSGQITGVLRETEPEESNGTNHPREGNQVVRAKQRNRGGEESKQEYTGENNISHPSHLIVPHLSQDRWGENPEHRQIQRTRQSSLKTPDKHCKYSLQSPKVRKVPVSNAAAYRMKEMRMKFLIREKKQRNKEQQQLQPTQRHEKEEHSICREGSKKWVQIAEVQMTSLYEDKDEEEQRREKQRKELMDMTLAAKEKVEKLEQHADNMGQRLQTIESSHTDRMRELTKVKESQCTAIQSVLQPRSEQTKMSQKTAQMEARSKNLNHQLTQGCEIYTMRGPDQEVCQMIGSECCTIPLHTGPLGPLRTLMDRMAAARDQMKILENLLHSTYGHTNSIQLRVQGGSIPASAVCVEFPCSPMQTSGHRNSHPRSKGHVFSNLIYPPLLSQSQTMVVGGLWNCQSAVILLPFTPIIGRAGETALVVPSLGSRHLCPSLEHVVRKSSSLIISFGGHNKSNLVNKQRHVLGSDGSQAYEVHCAASPLENKAYFTRGITLSSTLARGVSLEDICAVADWSYLHIYIRFYNLELDTTPGY
ncbi:hypothetical protein QTP86_009050 [Hemibagrus guttatus]|nr:hypothetical protein QTP86_009050 [Hemibagrus guttatus]